jgi:ATP-binding protein involved in chromosome partitioning
MPLHISLREDLDRSAPTVISRLNSQFNELYRHKYGSGVAVQLCWAI